MINVGARAADRNLDVADEPSIGVEHFVRLIDMGENATGDGIGAGAADEIVQRFRRRCAEKLAML